MSYTDGYASDASTNYEDVSDGESLSGSDLDEIEAIARVVRPQFVSDNDSIYTPAMNNNHRHTSKETSKRTNPKQAHQKPKAPILDYRTMNQQKAKEEYGRATNESKSSQHESVSSTNKKEVIPQEAKLAFARDKNPQPIKINLGDLSAQVEEARRKKREADDEERRRLASLNSNRHSANYPNYQNQKQPPNYEENERNSKLEELKKKAVEEERKAATKAMAPSDLAKEIFIKSNNNAEQQQNAEENSTTTHQDKDGDVIDADHDVDTSLEAVADEEEENLDERQEFYSFLDAINKNKTKDADRRTFLEPFSDESNTAAEQLGSLTLEERQRAMRVVNERNAKMYATLERIGHGGIASGGVHQHHTSNDTNNNGVHQQSARRQGGGSYSSSSSSKAIGTSTHDDDDDEITTNTTEDHVRVKAEKELAFQNARAFLEGLLLQEKFIDSVNALLDRAVPAFRYTKYTRAAGEFTIEQHRQWELFCQEIEKMVLKKLQTIMDVAEFFERVFDEDEKEQEQQEENEVMNNNDDEDDSPSGSSTTLSHDAWELILSVMKFEAFCSLMDSYIESAMDLEQQEQQGGDDDGKKQQNASSVAADPGTKSAASSNNNKPRPKAALFHALPRSSNASSSLQQQQQQLGVRKSVVPSSSSTSIRSGGGGELPSSMMQQQKLKAPRSAGSSTSTTTSSIAQSSSMTYTHSRPALGARTSNK